MVENSRLTIELKNVRAIEKANISLSGISVLAGENGSGKSTISKLTYTLIKTSIEYEQISDNFLKEELYDIYKGLDLISREFSAFFGKIEYIKIRNYLRKKFENIFEKDLNVVIKVLDNTISYLILKFQEIKKYKSETEIRINRIKQILHDLIHQEYNDTDKEDYSVIMYLELLKKHVQKYGKDSSYLKETRPIELLNYKLDELFFDSPLPDTFNVYEYGVPIIDRINKKLVPIHSFNRVVYIDTPMILGLDYQTGRIHWNELNDLLISKNVQNKFNKKIDDLFINQILQGDILIDEDLPERLYTYKRNDGNEFNLLECATGIKSFAYLHILYKNGFLNNKTLLIIDEPEAHLHPQWVVEYARIIVLLNKYLNVKFLIASHHPDMISAIKYIYEKEINNDNLQFYLADKVRNTNLYTYRMLEQDIDPIFTSFNIALERIDLYGKTK